MACPEPRVPPYRSSGKGGHDACYSRSKSAPGGVQSPSRWSSCHEPKSGGARHRRTMRPDEATSHVSACNERHGGGLGYSEKARAALPLSGFLAPKGPFPPPPPP